MQKRFPKLLTFFIIFCMLEIRMPECSAQAASAQIGFFTDVQQIEAGQVFQLTLEISSDAVIGGFEAYFSYDSQLIEYNLGPSCITGENGYLKIADMDAAPSAQKRYYTMHFTALEPGVCSLVFQGVPMVYSYEDGNAMSVMAQQSSLEIVAASDASDNSDLSALRISPGSLQPAFSPEITEYGVNLSEDTERLIVSAVAADPDATVTIEGQNSLTYGENHVNIRVTAQNGTVRLYHILAVRNRQETTPTPDATGESGNESDEYPFYVVEGEDNCLYFGGSYRYRIAETSDGVTVPDGFSPEVLLVNGETVPAYMKAQDDRYCLLILENSRKEVGLYRFDREEYTVQRYSPEIVEVKGNEQTEQYVKQLLLETKEYEKKKNQMSLLCGGLAVLVILFAAVCLRLFIRSRGYSDDELD